MSEPQSFHSHRRPFSSVPSVDYLYRSNSMDHALQQTERCIERSEGVACIVGASGLGKSMSCQALVRHFAADLQVVLLNSARLCTRRALLQNILFELGLPYRNMDEGDLRLTLTEFVRSSDRCPNGVLLIIDEAHTLPTRLLEEVRLLTNQVHHDRPSIRLVLVGTTSLEERLATAPFESLNQRIVSRCYLEALNAHDTHEYVKHQLNIANDPELPTFDDGALSAIYTATGGVARLINQLCDHVVVLAAADGSSVATSSLVEEAWSDLQQLPAPWHSDQSSETTSDGESTVIEFGELDEDADELKPLPDPDGKSDLSIDLYDPELTSRINPLLDPDESSGEFANSMLLPIAELGRGLDLEEGDDSESQEKGDHSVEMRVHDSEVSQPSDSADESGTTDEFEPEAESGDNPTDLSQDQSFKTDSPISTRPFDPNDPFAEEFEDESIVENTYASTQAIQNWNTAHTGLSDPEQDAEFQAAIADLNAVPTTDDTPSFPFAVTVAGSEVELDTLDEHAIPDNDTVETESAELELVPIDSDDMEEQDASSRDGLVPLSTYLEEQFEVAESASSERDDSAQDELSTADAVPSAEGSSEGAQADTGPVDVARFPAIGTEFISSGDVDLDSMNQAATVKEIDSAEEAEPAAQIPQIDDSSWPVTHSDHLMQASTLVSGLNLETHNDNAILDAFDSVGEIGPIDLNLGASTPPKQSEEPTSSETVAQPEAEVDRIDPSSDADDGLGEQILREIVAFRDVADFDPSTDPVMPEFRPPGSEADANAVSIDSTQSEEVSSSGEHETEDASRPDIVIVEPIPDVLSSIGEDSIESEPEPGFQSDEPPGNAHREDYRSLFDRLKG